MNPLPPPRYTALRDDRTFRVVASPTGPHASRIAALDHLIQAFEMELMATKAALSRARRMRRSAKRDLA